MNGEFVVPGTRLCAESEGVSGPGTYVRQGSIYASLLGKRQDLKNEEGGRKPVISVIGRSGATSAAAPRIGAVAMARITKITSRAATASIVCVDDAPLAEPFVGIIRFVIYLFKTLNFFFNYFFMYYYRPQDVRLNDVDSVEMSKCFRPGDVVKAQIVCSKLFIYVLKKKKMCLFCVYMIIDLFG